MNIREARLAAGMSQARLARAADVPQPNISAYENGRRMPGPEVRARITRALKVKPSDRIAQHREAIHEVVSNHHASNPRLFGSVARREDTPDSDVDVLVDFTDEASFLDEVGLRLELTDLLGVEVDVVGADTLRGGFRDRVLREAVPL